MDLKGRGVWDLSVDEVEWARAHIQLNNYVYAALKIAHSSAPPLDRVVRLREGAAPEPLRGPAAEIASLAAYLGNADPRVVRVNSVYHAFQLLAQLGRVRAADIPAALELLAALAHVVVLAESNDAFPLWFAPVVRPADARVRDVFARILGCEDVRAHEESWLMHGEEPDTLPDPDRDAIPYALMFVPSLAQCIIVMDENGVEAGDIGRAWACLESLVLRFEREHGLSDGESGGPGSVRDANQIRYRNTLYLYGGDFLRRQGRAQEAWDWYTRGILFRELPSFFGFYLTDMKTTERLLCASGLPGDEGRRTAVRDLIPLCVARVFAHAADYAGKLLAAIRRHPGLDLGQGRLNMDDRPWLYCGEASREPFLLALVWWHFFRGQPFEAIPYEKYLLF